MEQYLRRATIDDMDLLFQWANDPLVRENSFSTAQISYEEHKNWYQSVLKRKDCVQYIYMADQCPVGQVRITIQEDTAEIGYSICAEKRSLGYGKYLLTLIREKVKEEFPDIKKVIGKVKPENIASQKSFLNAGYKETYRFFEIEYGKGCD